MIGRRERDRSRERRERRGGQRLLWGRRIDTRKLDLVDSDASAQRNDNRDVKGIESIMHDRCTRVHQMHDRDKSNTSNKYVSSGFTPSIRVYVSILVFINTEQWFGISKSKSNNKQETRICKEKKTRFQNYRHKTTCEDRTSFVAFAFDRASFVAFAFDKVSSDVHRRIYALFWLCWYSPFFLTLAWRLLLLFL